MTKATFKAKSPLMQVVTIGLVAGFMLSGIVVPRTINAGVKPVITKKPITLITNGHLTICRIGKADPVVVKTVSMMVTAYSSTPEETDDTPFITASGKTVADGIIANNLLPFGTKVRIPELFGDKVFEVQDRMHSRKGPHQADIWMAKQSEAKAFGAKVADIEVLES